RLRNLICHERRLRCPEEPKDPRLSKPSERLSQLGLKDHECRERAVRENDTQQVRDHRQLEQERREIDDRQNEEPEHNLPRRRSDREAEPRMDKIGNDEDSEKAPPMRDGKGQLLYRHYRPPTL